MTAYREPVVEQRPVARDEVYEVDDRPTAASAGLRIFQILAAVAGGILFVMGLVAVFRVDFDGDLLGTTAEVAGFGFSAALAIAAIILGGIALAATLADQDRGTASFVGLLILVAGIAALVLGGQAAEDVQVDRDSAGLFVGIGAAIFVLSMIPWWGRRRAATVVRR